MDGQKAPAQLLAVSLGLLLAACSAAHSCPNHNVDGWCRSGPSRFDSILRWIPGDLPSLWLADCSIGWVDSVMPWATRGATRFGVAGRGFCRRGERGSWFEGDFDGVFVWELDDENIPSWWMDLDLWKHADLRDYARENAEIVSVGGVEVRRLRSFGSNERFDWYTVLEGRFLVRATDSRLLEQVMKGKGQDWRSRVLDSEIQSDDVSDDPITMLRRFDEVAGADEIGPLSDSGIQLGDVEALAFMVRAPEEAVCVVKTFHPDKAAAWLRSIDVSVEGFVYDGDHVTCRGGEYLSSGVPAMTLVWMFGCNLIR